jgi:hypothetical protein
MCESFLTLPGGELEHLLLLSLIPMNRTVQSHRAEQQDESEVTMTTEERLEQVEGQLGRVIWLNRCLVASIVLFLGACVMKNSVMPETAWAQSGGKEIRANQFTLEDENGKLRAALGVNKGTAGLMLFAENGKPRAMLRVSKDGPGLYLLDENGKPRAELSMDEDVPGLVLHEENGNVRAMLAVGKEGPMLGLNDENNKPRVGLGLFKNGPSLWLSDKDGKPIWSAP